MGILLANKTNIDLLNSSLINYGIITVNIENTENTLEILKKNKCNIFLIDFDITNNKAYELIKIIKEDDDVKNIYLIGTSINASEQFIKKIQTYGLISFIAKPFDFKLLNEKCNKLLEKFKDHFPDRKHVRIQPMDDEFVRVSFQLKNKKHISAKVINISMGGLACLMYTSNNENELKQGNLIEHIIFEVNNKEINIDAKIISKKDKFIGFLFTHFYNDSNKNLANYILKKVSI